MEVAGEPVGEIVKLATDLGGGAAETEKVGELQPDDPKTNRRASRATYVFRQSPLSRAPRPFVGPVLKGRNGSRNYGDRDKGLAPLSLCESR